MPPLLNPRATGRAAVAAAAAAEAAEEEEEDEAEAEEEAEEAAVVAVAVKRGYLLRVRWPLLTPALHQPRRASLGPRASSRAARFRTLLRGSSASPRSWPERR